jgi:hypothetical protein
MPSQPLRTAGIFVIILLGFPLHYMYSWSGESAIIGIFAPVNESVWEHLKLGYYSVVLLSIPEHLLKGKSLHNYFPARIAGLLAMELTILLIFYGYHLLTSQNYFLIDIGSYMAGAVICQLISFRIFRLAPFSKTLQTAGLAAFIAPGVVFAITTFYPPHLPIFKDHNSGNYVIFKVK